MTLITQRWMDGWKKILNFDLQVNLPGVISPVQFPPRFLLMTKFHGME